MDIICTFCSTKLAIQDGKVPKNADFRVTCPRCQTKFRVSTKTDQARARGAGGVLRSWFAPPSAAPPPPPEPEEPMEERSEEHTSELQSRPHLVCRLLLEKKTIHFTEN